jgi:hypothetical protein
MKTQITQYPCNIDPTLKTECLENGAFDRYTGQRFHACGSAFKQTVDVVQVEFVPVTRTTQKQLKALRVEARELVAQGLEKKDAWKKFSKAKALNRFVPLGKPIGREGTGDRKLIYYTGRKLQGKGVTQYSVKDWRRLEGFKAYTLPQLPAQV